MKIQPLFVAGALVGSAFLAGGAQARILVSSDAPGSTGDVITGSQGGTTATVTSVDDGGNLIGLLSTITPEDADTQQRFVGANTGVQDLDAAFLGQDYTFSVDVLGAGDSATDEDFLFLQFFVDGTSVANSFNSDGNTTSIGGLSGPLTLEFSATLPDAGSTYQAELTYVDGGFEGGGGVPSAGGPVLTFDNFVVDFPAVAEVPEPASLALVGLGGLALLGRRRSA